MRLSCSSVPSISSMAVMTKSSPRDCSLHYLTIDHHYLKISLQSTVEIVVNAMHRPASFNLCSYPFLSSQLSSILQQSNHYISCRISVFMNKKNLLNEWFPIFNSCLSSFRCLNSPLVRINRRVRSHQVL